MDLKSSAKKYRVQLYRNKNSLTGIARLSDETIRTVMSYGELGYVIHCSLICHRWRQVALNQPRLWSQIDLTRQKLNARLLSIQMERSGNYPLDIKFGLGRHQYSSLLTLPSLASLLARARAVREIEPQIWIQLDISESFQMPHLEQIEGKFDADSLRYIAKAPKLLHLSIAVNSQNLFPSLAFSRYLRTLYISNASDFPTTVVSVVSELSRLEELYLISMLNPNLSEFNLESSVVGKEIPNLRFLCIKDCPYLFIFQILKFLLVSKSTNLYIEINISRKVPPAPQHRGRGPSTLSVDALLQSSSLFGWQNSLIEIALKSGEHIRLILQLPIFTYCDHITALELNRDLLTAEEMSRFPSLIQLNIRVQVKPASVEKKPLATILNAFLPYSCPKLAFIGLTLQKMGPEIALYGDGAGAAIEKFLKEWVKYHGKPFGTIQVQDMVNPARWYRRITPNLESMLQSFDLVTTIVPFSYSRPVTRYDYRAS
jgi:hypothetical protein